MAVADNNDDLEENINSVSIIASAGPQWLLERILDRCLRAILAITPERDLLYQNAPARLLASRQNLLQVRDGKLHFIDRGVLAKVDQHISGEQRSLRKRSTSSNALALRTYTRAASDKPREAYRVLVTPLDACESMAARISKWLVFVSELRAERRITIEVLTELYGLTVAESSLVVHLFSGHSLEEAAREQDISINTAKTHLRQVFQKCGVQSQASLLQLLALGPRAF